MKRLVDIFLFPLAYISGLLYIAYLKTIQVQVINNELSPAQMPASKNAIYLFWHSKTFLILPYCRNRQIGILTLLDLKNRFYNFLSRSLGYQTVAVTSQQKAALRLIQILEEGFHIALAADGPYGPPGTVKPGPFYLAKKTGRPIIPVRIQPQRSFRLNWRWDKYEIPFPFTKTKIFLGAPIYFSEIMHDEENRVKSELGPYLPIPSQPGV